MRQTGLVWVSRYHLTFHLAQPQQHLWQAVSTVRLHTTDGAMATTYPDVVVKQQRSVEGTNVKWVLVRGLLPTVHLQETTRLLPIDPPHPQSSVFFYVPWSQPLTVSLSNAPFRPQMATVTCWPIPVLAGPPGPAATIVTVRSYCYAFLELKLNPGEGSQKCSCIKVVVCRTFGVLALLSARLNQIIILS